MTNSLEAKKCGTHLHLLHICSTFGLKIRLIFGYETMSWGKAQVACINVCQQIFCKNCFNQIFRYNINNITKKNQWGMISRPGQSLGLLYKQPCGSFIQWFSQWVSKPFPPTALRRRHSQTNKYYSTSCYKIDYVVMIKNFLNPKGHQKPLQWFKSYSHFTQELDLAYYWSCIG